ncbi:MAG: hypothetical protein ACYCSH_14235 [Acidithiobacillus sp.]
MLSGLIHATGANSINKLPWLGDIPILGALFRDTLPGQTGRQSHVPCQNQREGPGHQ